MNSVIVTYIKEEQVVKVSFTTFGDIISELHFDDCDQVGIITRIMRWIRDGRID